MKKVLFLLIALSSFIYAQSPHMKHKMFQSVPFSKATILQDTKAKMFCPSCGMTLPMFYKTNHSATLNGHVKQYCSLHCLVEDNIKSGSALKNIKVVDTKSLKFIDVKDAIYVVGSKKKGTMTMKSKYAFSNMKDAKAFESKFGGKIMNFNKAYKIASKAFKKEKMMISKKQAMMAKKGKMLYTRLCKKTDKLFTSTAQAKEFVVANKLCGNIKGKPLQAIGLYLKQKK